MPKPVSLNKPVTRIGRAPGNDVVLPYDTQVSRQHAEVRRDGLAFTLYDLNSQNGTFVNNARVTRHTLREGDQVRVGNTALYFQGGGLWVPDEAIVTPATAGATLALPLVLGFAGLVLLGAVVLIVSQFSPGSRPPVESVVAVTGVGGTSGSGTIVDSRGLILTANTVVGGAPAPLVGLITRPEVPPTVWFQSRVVVADGDLNLAVLVVTNQVSGEPIAGPLNLPAVALGNSDGLVEGERLKVIGYPAVGLPIPPGSFGEIVRVQDAVVARFQIWPGGTRQWVELDRDVGNAGFLGGAVLNSRNELVGLPLPELAAPRQVRPVNLAEGLIRQARVTLGW